MKLPDWMASVLSPKGRLKKHSLYSRQPRAYHIKHSLVPLEDVNKLAVNYKKHSKTADSATVLGSILAASDTVDFEGIRKSYGTVKYVNLEK